MLSLAKSLFASTPHVTITTALTLDDFIMVDLPSEGFYERSKTIKGKGVALVLKDTAVELIVNAFSSDNTKYAKVDHLDSTMINFPFIKCTFHSYTTLRVAKDVSYRGLRSRSTKLARFEKIQHSADQEFESNKATLIDDAITKLNKSLSDIINTNNDKVVSLIKACVVDINLNKDTLNDIMTNEEKAATSEIDTQVAALNKQIDELNKRKKALTNKAYCIKRESIVNAINNECDQPIKDIAKSFADTKRATKSIFFK